MITNPVEIIRKKRSGQELEDDEVKGFIERVVRGEIPDYQAAALLMSVYFQGMTAHETAVLTRAMAESGTQIEFEDDAPKIDKHSTGGVGDKVSIILGPLVASLAVDVPMVAGRGLGHTGGTIDKLEAIPGYKTQMSAAAFKKSVLDIGVAIVGQTNDFVPADKILYALRDVTATVESVPLITASILSKKYAEGISGLVLDIKVGSGAFMKNLKDAETLAKSLISTGKKLGLKVKAVLTDMSQPLGRTAGHALEIQECLDVLEGTSLANTSQDLKDVTIELAAQMLVLGDKASSLAAARKMSRDALVSRKAAEKFFEMVENQGCTLPLGGKSLDEKFQLLRKALGKSSVSVEITAPKSGLIGKIETEELGFALIDIGGGRRLKTDAIDLAAGLVFERKLGASVKRGETLVRMHYNPKNLRMPLEQIQSRIQKAFVIYSSKSSGPKVKFIKKVL